MLLGAVLSSPPNNNSTGTSATKDEHAAESGSLLGNNHTAKGVKIPPATANVTAAGN
ncbi:hypothetical protein AA106556_0556 [Neokomagataea tanensis NBRC 106556]|uniref:Uncharacterized protein n=1 Tax=Neokomagataea tanensis NBRC 106556 TaxID=1223519 RepID=A0ABQ0QHB1_9PROT|nr:hypothetical protein AA106556_0556 [Neokomagataea tanensis NBRC 106556]